MLEYIKVAMPIGSLGGAYRKQRNQQVIDGGVLQSTLASLGERCTGEIGDHLDEKQLVFNLPMIKIGYL